jgi:hypothetical protein
VIESGYTGSDMFSQILTHLWTIFGHLRFLDMSVFAELCTSVYVGMYFPVQRCQTSLHRGISERYAARTRADERAGARSCWLTICTIARGGPFSCADPLIAVRFRACRPKTPIPIELQLPELQKIWRIHGKDPKSPVPSHGSGEAKIVPLGVVLPDCADILLDAPWTTLHWHRGGAGGILNALPRRGIALRREHRGVVEAIIRGQEIPCLWPFVMPIAHESQAIDVEPFHQLEIEIEGKAFVTVALAHGHSGVIPINGRAAVHEGIGTFRNRKLPRFACFGAIGTLISRWAIGSRIRDIFRACVGVCVGTCSSVGVVIDPIFI